MRIITLILLIILSTTSFSSNYKGEMLKLLKEAKRASSGGIVIANGGIDIYFDNGRLNKRSLNSVDGVVVESMYYGATGGYNKKTSSSDTRYMEKLATIISRNRKRVLLIEYTNKRKNMIDAIKRASKRGFLTHFARSRELDKLPYGHNNRMSRSKSLYSIADFGIILNPRRYSSKRKYVSDLASNPNDLLIIDREFNGRLLSKGDIRKIKRNGKKLIAYISLAEAEDYRSYWHSSWSRRRPNWIASENPNWPGNFRVKYWTPTWKKIVFNQIRDARARGFDGVFLDVVDTYQYFEGKY